MVILPDPGKLDYYASLGASEAVLRLPSVEREAVMPVLDGFTQYLSGYPQIAAKQGLSAPEQFATGDSKTIPECRLTPRRETPCARR
jgi:hypothetical protein